MAPRLAPVAAAGAACATAVYLAATDGASWTPGCVFHSLTGLWCPGCGLTRAATAALRGDLLGALSHNLLAPAFALALALAWIQWWQRAHGRAGMAWLGRAPGWAPVAALVVLVVFGVARNLPMAPFVALGP